MSSRIGQKKNMCVYCHLLKKNRVGRSDLFIFLKIFFILKLSEFGFFELLFLIFLYLLTVLNTLSTVIDDIIPLGYRKRQNFQENKKFPINRVGRVTVSTHIFLFGHIYKIIGEIIK
jgi:hypothetical protein